MDPLFDHTLMRQRRVRALAGFTPGADFLIRRVAEDMADRLSVVERRFENPFQVHGGLTLAAETMSATGKTAAFRFVDQYALPGLDTSAVTLAGPDQVPIAPGSADLIVSPLALHLTNDTPGVLVQMRRALKPDGLLLAATPGAGTLGELRESLLAAESELTGGANARIHPYADIRDYGALLQRAGFALPVTDIDDIVVRYADMFGLLRDLRAMGMTSMLMERSRRPVGRSLFLRAAQIYAERFSDPDGRIRASFPVIHLSGWAPHESQQKPLKPGSAKTRLADALRTPEQKLPR
ncbi:MAG: methyltransferase domain-containing protein [Hoeflea sp.]|uniref:methyltransferase domain-containing protein n=1 Tax=Hoeflea sp. TaxID=1940281 RepID=UPI001D1E150A|nr:methyltransferase domain-containing protein [Hoeflea sp.]MBU4528687.1 methyltransferase domain-containing protein [Alphaproteobacteria bacterium]MBU4545508.1 methyltransferase domain-containing protein [Alphaproteobacteria bacterium]MBU4552118.1 methyltransferase domain-containing protein [Alphaproteobacteria bacterium]MBV1726290.1 methyltransferase domain-containing protein [Hoeflea sp.]MBV1762283.1 methyltransferase domain-containing protein [Hoeflea sp.]